MVSDKTASLISAACRVGPLLAGAPREMVDGLTKYGESLGLAFQIADDILDFTGDESTLGKPVGRDLRERKITLPLIKSLAAAPEVERAAIIRVLSAPEPDEEDWNRVFDFVDRHDGVAAASRHRAGVRRPRPGVPGSARALRGAHDPRDDRAPGGRARQLTGLEGQAPGGARRAGRPALAVAEGGAGGSRRGIPRGHGHGGARGPVPRRRSGPAALRAGLGD